MDQKPPLLTGQPLREFSRTVLVSLDRRSPTFALLDAAYGGNVTAGFVVAGLSELVLLKWQIRKVTHRLCFSAK
jgi:hypothetical protein